MKPLCCFFLVCFAFLTNTLFSQGKFERESRVKTKEVPEEALAFFDQAQSVSKIKWFREESFDGISFEAKFSLRKKKYSVEFDSLGRVSDIEIQEKWNTMDSGYKNKVVSKLENDCEKYKIAKVQRQYTGNPEELRSLITENNISGNLTIRYEMVIRCKHQKNTEQYEYLFDEQGNVLSVLKIIMKNSSHLEY